MEEDQSPLEATQLPAVQKPSMVEWLESYLPFRLPKIPLPQTAKNLDKAASRLVEASTNNAVARISVSTGTVEGLGKARHSLIDRGVQQIRSSSYADLDTRSLSYVIEEARLGQINREKILEIAAEEIERDPPDQEALQEISDDWLNVFSRLASEKTDRDIQNLWAKILSGEIRNPGATKIRTLQQLSAFDKEDANFAYELLRSAVDGSWLLLDYYTENSKFELILRGQEIGLLNSESTLTFSLDGGSMAKFPMGTRVVMVTPQSKKVVVLNNCSLTSLAKDLYRLLKSAHPDENIIEKLCKSFASHDVAVKVGEKGEKIGEDSWRVVNIKTFIGDTK